MGDRASHCCNNGKSFIGMQEGALSMHSKTLDVELQSSQERPGTAMKTLVGIISKVAALESAAVGYHCHTQTEKEKGIHRYLRQSTEHMWGIRRGLEFCGRIQIC